MLLELALWLGKDARFFNVFGYITLRTMLAAGTALLLSLVFGPLVIRWLAGLPGRRCPQFRARHPRAAAHRHRPG